MAPACPSAPGTKARAFFDVWAWQDDAALKWILARRRLAASVTWTNPQWRPP